MRTAHRSMRPVYQPVEAFRLIAGQPGVQRLARPPTFEATCEIDNPSLITANTAR
jgi:hypothetical protein